MDFQTYPKRLLEQCIRCFNNPFLRIAFVLLIFPIVFQGCMTAVNRQLTDGIAGAILNSNDPETVKDGGPAYLLMIDGMVREDPENPNLLSRAADLYAAYAAFYDPAGDRAKRLTQKAFDYASDAVCAAYPESCGTLRQGDFDTFKSFLAGVDADDIHLLHSLGASWAAWIQTHKQDWNAVAEISRVEALMKRVVELDDTYRNGSAHLYLGILATLLPPAMGGHPEEGRRHFEQAIRISNGRNLMAKVAYAKHYARLVFDRELHDRLLNEVLKSPAEAEGFTLINTLAQQEARTLLDTSEEYFE